MKVLPTSVLFVIPLHGVWHDLSHRSCSHAHTCRASCNGQTRRTAGQTTHVQRTTALSGGFSYSLAIASSAAVEAEEQQQLQQQLRGTHAMHTYIDVYYNMISIKDIIMHTQCT